ncbi:MAG: putative glycoside hydrolase [Clostridia bacterium]|nr:putative glycoside hydrolase [Clostridia bacterium]
MRNILKIMSILTAIILLTCIVLTACTGVKVKVPDASEKKSEQSDGEKTNPTEGQSEESKTNDTKPSENANNKSEQPGNQNQGDNASAKKPKLVKARAVYLTGWSAGNMTKLQQIIELINTTELNAVVLDIKDDDGKVGYETGIQEVREIGGWERKYDVDKVIKLLHENNIYVIGRLVCFKDPILPNKRVDLAYKSVNGGVWRDNRGRAWVNPLNKDSWQYILNIAKEAADKGFDEIQYDYIRFPNAGDGGNVKLIDFGPNFDPNTKSDFIAEFLRISMKEIREGKGIPLSADLFAIAAVGTADDKTLGQNWEKLCAETDYICPMAYPSHYAPGQSIRGVTFAKPDLEPYAVVYQTLMTGKERLEKLEKKAIIRPYLQAFSAPWLGAGNWQRYGAKQIREQIKAVYDAGYDEWILWAPDNVYPLEAFEK